MLHILSILALATLHDLVKSCKKLCKIHMLHSLSILALTTLHDLVKSCKKLCKIHMLHNLSILALTTLHDLAKSYKKLGKIKPCIILPRCLAMYFQDHSRSCSIMQDIFARETAVFFSSGALDFEFTLGPIPNNPYRLT